MNARKVTIMAAVLTLRLFSLEESALAQEETAVAQGDCRRVKGQKVSVNDAATNTTTGIITKGGRLNGTTVEVFRADVSPTPDLTTVTFAADLTLTTSRGRLKASNVYLFDFAAGVGPVFWRINPTTSTGRFAGATGVVYTAAKLTSVSPDTFFEEITGAICFADEGHQR
jgi:hypothetical protein